LRDYKNKKNARLSHCTVKKFLSFDFSYGLKGEAFARNLTTEAFVKRPPQQIIYIVDFDKMKPVVIFLKQTLSIIHSSVHIIRQ